MTTTQRDAQALTYLATRLREEVHGCAKWDQTGTYAVISELVGQNLAETIRRVIGHATDPDARTPGAIKRPFVPKAPETPGVRFPAKPGDDCRAHPGEYAASCRACAADRLAGDEPAPAARPIPTPDDLAAKVTELRRNVVPLRPAKDQPEEPA